MPTTDTTRRTLPEQFAGLRFDNHYARLPKHFYAPVEPTPVYAPGLIKVNHELARELELDPVALESPDGIAVLAGNAIPPGAEPLAQAYAGHQFGYRNPRLGDGRAVLLGEVRDRDGNLRDIQLKGSGPTPFSRQGDGRAAAGPVVREYVVSEAMHALGISTTRALAAVTTGDLVYRETPLPGAVLTRVASSHLRIGTFEFFHGRDDQDAVRRLADFAIERHYPDAAQADEPYRALLDAVIDAQAGLVASWLHVGFIHGVMNTDNMSISGETIDYGPCAFMDTYNPATVFSSIDARGRYAYSQQPNIALWNLSRFAECLLFLFDEDSQKAVEKAEKQLRAYPELFDRYWLTGMGRKVGLLTQQEGDEEIVQTLLRSMHEHDADYTLTFRELAFYLSDTGLTGSDNENHRFVQRFGEGAKDILLWLTSWRARLVQEERSVEKIVVAMKQVNPAYIPRNHRVEAVIRAAVDKQDYAPLHEMVEVLGNPFNEQDGMERYAEPPPPGQEVYRTFCGT